MPRNTNKVPAVVKRVLEHVIEITEPDKDLCYLANYENLCLAFDDDEYQALVFWTKNFAGGKN